ncbi:hypothetical protein OFN60_38755, partial [Escherichia coli]|nr:hypothetical protein [Escherichia coli]
AIIVLAAASAPERSTLAVAAADAPYNLSIEAPWTAHVRKSDPAELQLNVSEREGSMLGVSVKLSDLEGLTREELNGTGRPVTF